MVPCCICPISGKYFKYSTLGKNKRETKTPRVQKKGKAKKNQRLKALISNKAKKSVNESVT